MSKLKPCPFCGGEAAIHREYDGVGPIKIRATCNGCGATSPKIEMISDEEDYNERIKEAWNRRAESCDTCRYRWCNRAICLSVDGECDWDKIDYCSGWRPDKTKCSFKEEE